MDQTHQTLDEFGRLLVERVRDKAILEWDKILDGQMPSTLTQEVRQQIASFSPQQLELVWEASTNAKRLQHPTGSDVLCRVKAVGNWVPNL